MLILILLLSLLSLGLFNILDEKGGSFYKDQRFWTMLFGIILLTALSSMLYV